MKRTKWCKKSDENNNNETWNNWPNHFNRITAEILVVKLNARMQLAVYFMCRYLCGSMWSVTRYTYSGYSFMYNRCYIDRWSFCPRYVIYKVYTSCELIEKEKERKREIERERESGVVDVTLLACRAYSVYGYVAHSRNTDTTLWALRVCVYILFRVQQVGISKICPENIQPDNELK